jgi:hypothetical protein
MAFRDTILDVRNMRRSIQLRGIEDPKEVTALLEKVLREAVIAQASGSRTFGRKAFNELTQIRQDLVAGQINAGASKDSMVGIYSHLIDQMSSMQQDNKRSSTLADNAFERLSSSIPSADTFISALMTANPLVGYGVKIARDIMRSTKANAASQKAEKAKRLAILKEQEKFIEEQLKAKEDEVKAGGDEDPFLNETYGKLLEDIRNEIAELRKQLTGDGLNPDGAPPILDPGEKKVINSLDDIDRALKAQFRQDKILTADEIDAMHDQAILEDRQRKLDRLRGEDPVPPDLGPGPDVGPDSPHGGGFLKMLEGFMAPIMMLLRTSLVAFAGAAIGLFTTMVAIPALIATAIYKFLDGFFNAEEIIGKASSDITMLDRVKAGVANIWGTILKIVDWVTNLFGFDLFDSTNMEKKIYGALDDGQRKITETFNNIVDYGKEKLKSIEETIKKIYDDVFGMFTASSKFLTEKYEKLTGFFDSLANKGILETFREMANTPEDPSLSPHRQQDPQWSGDVPVPEGPTIYQGDVPIPQAPRLQQDLSPNPGIIRMGNPKNIKSTDLEASLGKQITQSMRIAEANSSKNKASGGAPIIAPTTNNNSVNNHQYNGPPTTANLEPDFRSIMRT